MTEVSNDKTKIRMYYFFLPWSYHGKKIKTENECTHCRSISGGCESKLLFSVHVLLIPTEVMRKMKYEKRAQMRNITNTNPGEWSSALM